MMDGPDEQSSHLRRAADYVAKYDESDESVAALAALVEMQNDFTRRAEAAVRLRRRFGLNRRPTSTMEVALAVLESSQRIEGLLGELIALTRASVSLPFSSLHQLAHVSNTALRRSLALLLLPLLMQLLLLRLRRSGVGWTPPLLLEHLLRPLRRGRRRRR
jgi:hypothetical protein